MSNIVSFMPVERLDDLVAATGFNLDNTDYQYKFTWLLERIGILREAASNAAIVHDNPEQNQLVAVIKQEQAWSKGLASTIASHQVQMESMRREIEKLKRELAAA